MAAKAHCLTCQLKLPEVAAILEELVRSGIVCLRTNFNHKARGKWKVNGLKIPQCHSEFFFELCLSWKQVNYYFSIAISTEKRDMIANILSWFLQLNICICKNLTWPSCFVNSPWGISTNCFDILKFHQSEYPIFIQNFVIFRFLFFSYLIFPNFIQSDVQNYYVIVKRNPIIMKKLYFNGSSGTADVTIV